jgi:hypothetical protein
MIARGDTLDLRGYTITGAIRSDADHVNNGITIFNGTVNCNVPDGAVRGCIGLITDTTLSTQARLHHLTVDNAADPGSGAVRAIHVESDGVTAPPGAGYKIDHVTITVESAPYAVRSVAINASTQDNIEISYNALTCSFGANACNAIQLMNGTAQPVAAYIHDNQFIMNSSPSITETARGLLVMGTDQGTSGPSGFQVYNNICMANTNRCFRARQVSGASFFGNTVLNCQNTSSGCYHFGDPDNPANAVANLGINVYNETIGINGGTAFYVRNAQGISVKDVAISGTIGRLSNVTTYQSPIATDATFCRITGASGLGTPSNVDSGGAGHVYQAGTWAGTGTVDNLGTCP